MEIVFFLAFIVFPACLSIYVIATMVNRARKEDEEYKLAIPSRESLEESIDGILERHRQSRRKRRIEQKNTWDSQFLKSLPVEEHPEYFELDLRTDEVEEFVSKSASGEICQRITARANKYGTPYQAEVDWVTQNVIVTTQNISWAVPLKRVDNYRELM